jgi:hypothetical protein
MKTAKIPYVDDGHTRAHPYTGSAHDPRVRCYNFRFNPELIRTNLEDFDGWSEWPSIQRFYKLLEWLNGDKSELESNDCAFRGPKERTNGGHSPALECESRLMIFYRRLDLNTSCAHIQLLLDMLYRACVAVNPDCTSGAIGIGLVNCAYLGLPQEERHGYQIELRLQAYGNSDTEAMTNLDTVVGNTFCVLKRLTPDITKIAMDLPPAVVPRWPG